MQRQGRRCLQCGSCNTGGESALRRRPGIVAVIFFGWVFLLMRHAFSRSTEVCRDCGAVSRFKTIGSWLALGVFMLLAIATSIGVWFA